MSRGDLIENDTRKSKIPSPQAIRWVVDSVGRDATIADVFRLAGATSSALFGVDVAYRNRIHQFVLRLYVNKDWLKNEPDLSRHEAEALLKVTEAKAISSPELLAFDEHGDHCGYPALLMTRLQGAVDLQPADMDKWLFQLAEALVPIHQIEDIAFPWRYFTYNEIALLDVPAWSAYPGLWRRALDILSGTRPDGPYCFIHRDYHPTNVLFHEGRISGVVDWVNSCAGPRGIDVGHCRLNLAGLFSPAAADRFLEHYQSLAGPAFTYDPYWDLLALIEFLPGPPDVYSGWTDFGVQNLNPQIMLERQDAYLASVMGRL